MNKRISLIGVIAEDDCDVNCIKIFVQRIKSNDRIGFKKFVGKGCGKIKRKAHSWANQLKIKGCKSLILVHDLDKNNISELRHKLQSALDPCPIKDHFICIPIQELEAWLISDPESIKRSMGLKKISKIKGRPEEIDSPKELLGEFIQINSNHEKIYLNTKHNEQIAQNISLEVVKSKCPSFDSFYKFVDEKIK